jgi:isoquinoline 1-oxidoreductase beta subunit
VKGQQRGAPCQVGLDRRVFLQSAARCGAGLVLALALPAGFAASRAVAGAQVRQLNAWLRIGTDDSITVIVDRSEMGQPIYHYIPVQ